MLWYLRQYFEYWIMFNRIDSSHDRRLSMTEFKHALREIRKWGVVVEDAEAAFREIDEDGHGMILFDEFCNWAIAKHLDLEDDDDAEGTAMKVQEKYVAGSGHKNKKSSEHGHKKSSHGKRSQTRAKKQPDDVWKRLSDALPWQKTKEDQKKRREMFRVSMKSP